jgi:hypothetical protein
MDKRQASGARALAACCDRDEGVTVETGAIRNRAEAYHAPGFDRSDGPDPGENIAVRRPSAHMTQEFAITLRDGLGRSGTTALLANWAAT